MGFIFLTKLQDGCMQLYQKCIPQQVLFKIFGQICSYLSKFRDILVKSISQKNLVVATNRLLPVRFSRYSFPQKRSIQGRKLVSEETQDVQHFECEFSCTEMTKNICIFKLQYVTKIGGFHHAAEPYSESFQTSKAELFVKKSNGFQLLTSLAKSSTSYVLQGS